MKRNKTNKNTSVSSATLILMSGRLSLNYVELESASSKFERSSVSERVFDLRNCPILRWPHLNRQLLLVFVSGTWQLPLIPLSRSLSVCGKIIHN